VLEEGKRVLLADEVHYPQKLYAGWAGLKAKEITCHTLRHTMATVAPPHKWHGFRIFAHNPEVLSSNLSPATFFQTPISGRFWFKHALLP